MDEVVQSLLQGSIVIDAVATAEEIAAMDVLKDVARLDDLLLAVEDDLRAGLAAVAEQLRAKYGAAIVVHVTGEAV